MKKNRKERLAAKVEANEKVEKERLAAKVEANKKIEKVITETKAEKTKETVLDDAAALNVAKRITDKKDLKYKYPKETDTLALRKKFRAEVRREIKAFDRLVSKAADEEAKTKALTKRQRYLEKHLSNSSLLHIASNV